ncbi:hypothetical protein [Streptomyces tardus]|uniref:hypothetical protein n=1 Tax=Streptomyces tardus TaxID=2780544 RepID=UPI0027E49BF8|nr:hypothetical protein [Streptomyces tardus]
MIDTLYRNDHRVVAPSFGFDASRVLTHALKARRVATAWALAVTALMAIGVAATGTWMLILILPGLLLTLSAHADRLALSSPGRRRRLSSFALRWFSRLLLTWLVLVTVWQALGVSTDDDVKDSEGKSADAEQTKTSDIDANNAGADGTGTLQNDEQETGFEFGDLFPEALLPPDQLEAWLGLLVLLALGACVAGRQLQFVQLLRSDLSARVFSDVSADPAERARKPRLSWVLRRIRSEQHSPLVMYHEARPFCGAGVARDPWSLAVELRQERPGAGRPIGNAAVLAAVRPYIEQLREVAGSSQRDGHPVRDRLRQLEIDECVFLPMEGLRRREEAPYDRASFEEHRARATEEGGEMRRHFLRIRVSGWEQGLVVTVFVRVHTQGRMLMLEVAPHTLLPVRADFKDADHLLYRFADVNRFGKAVHIFTMVAGAPGSALMTLGHQGLSAWRRMTGEDDRSQTDGPALSVRELASEPKGSLFQTMDVDRYLKSIQDRIAYGVKTALAEAGYETDEFTQKVIHVSNGGVNIDSVVDSTFAVGTHAHATTDGAQSPSPRGASSGQ